MEVGYRSEGNSASEMEWVEESVWSDLWHHRWDSRTVTRKFSEGFENPSERTSEEHLIVKNWKMLESAQNWRPNGTSRGTRSLNNMMNIIWNGMLKALCYRLAPLQFGGNHIVVIFSQNMHQNMHLFRAPNAKISLPWEGVSLLAVLLGGPLTRIFEPPKNKNAI